MIMGVSGLAATLDIRTDKGETAMTADDRRASRRYRDRVGLPGQQIRLPWPMTSVEAAVFLVIVTTLGIAVGTIVTEIWELLQLAELSLWRIVPPLVGLTALLVMVPGLVRAMKPADLDRRYAALRRDRDRATVGGRGRS